ncbi:MAG: helix-turn-helix transcriptional regulator [Coriobacteriales bacterium]|nr:helix-turn-helix transcriptional regulator [Coriobacteriales bacterium]
MPEIPDAKSPHGTTKRVWEVSPFVVFGLCGFTLYLAWMFIVYISPSMAPEIIIAPLEAESADPSLYLLFRLVQVATLFVVLLVAWRLSDTLSSMQGVLVMLVGSVVLESLAFVVVALPSSLVGMLDPTVQLVMALVASVLMGVGQGFMILLWSSFLCTIGEHRIVLFVTLCIGCAAGLVLLRSFLQPSPAVWVTLPIVWLSMGCFAYIRFRLPETPKPLLVKGKTSDRRQHISTKSIVSVIIYCTAIGFAASFIACSGSGLFGVVAAAVAVILAAVITGLDSARFRLITEDHLVKLHAPAAIIGFAPLIFNDLTAQILGCAFLLCFFMIVFIVNLTALSEHVRVYRLNSIRAFGFGRADNAVGFLVGAFLFYLSYFPPYELLFGTIEQHTWETLLLLGFLAAFVLASSFVFGDHYPASRGSAKNAVKAKAVESKGNMPRGDLYTLSTYMLTEPEDPDSKRSGIWTQRVKALSREFGLSPKETEVLFLLAKGRNAEHIQNELVVSRHTAKAHIYHIYQKTGVHSRQALIDMLENVEVDYE